MMLLLLTLFDFSEYNFEIHCEPLATIFQMHLLAFNIILSKPKVHFIADRAIISIFHINL
jgi:hypothetical protein